MAAIIRGGGLRVSECCELRMKDVDFDQGLLYVRQGKGDKDRASPGSGCLTRSNASSRTPAARLRTPARSPLDVLAASSRHGRTERARPGMGAR